MAVDRDGAKLAVGDVVWIEARVKVVYERERQGNLDVQVVQTPEADADYCPLICIDSKLCRRVVEVAARGAGSREPVVGCAREPGD